MKALIPTGTKVRVIALGCGTKIPNLLMTEGSSEWLDSIETLYSYESIKRLIGEKTFDKWKEKNGSTVTQEFTDLVLKKALEQEDYEDLVTIVFNAATGYVGQREGRINHYFVSTSEGIADHVILNSKDSRDAHEQDISDYIIGYFLKHKTKVIFSGSFNPFHDAHHFILNQLGKIGVTRQPVIVDVTNCHPEKGTISEEEMEGRIHDLMEIQSDTEFDIVQSNAPKFLDKYNFYRNTEGKELLVFVIGYDVWETYKESFEEEFGDKLDVCFLVFNRYDNTVKDGSPILHPESFSVDIPVDLLHISSTAIRDGQ